MFPARHRSLNDIEVTELASFAKCILHCRPANAGLRCHSVDRCVTYTTTLDFTGDDAEPSALALSVMMAQRIRQSASTAQTATPLHRCLTIGRPGRPPRRETAAQATADGCQRFRCDNTWHAGRAPPERPALVGNVGEERRLVIRKLALVVMVPNRPDDIVDLVERKRAVDEFVKATGDYAEDWSAGGGRSCAHCSPLTINRSNAASASVRFPKRPRSRLRASYAAYCLSEIRT